MTKKHYPSFCSLRSQKRERGGSNFGLCSKFEPLSPLFAGAKRVRKGVCLFCHVLKAFIVKLKSGCKDAEFTLFYQTPQNQYEPLKHSFQHNPPRASSTLFDGQNLSIHP
jgi:hypothetical protein